MSILASLLLLGGLAIAVLTGEPVLQYIFLICFSILFVWTGLHVFYFVKRMHAAMVALRLPWQRQVIQLSRVTFNFAVSSVVQVTRAWKEWFTQWFSF
jgi:hypothetical protein